jgi:hypothetical protein
MKKVSILYKKFEMSIKIETKRHKKIVYLMTLIILILNFYIFNINYKKIIVIIVINLWHVVVP